MIYLFCGSSPLSYGRGGGDIDIIFIRSPGCGSQRLLRPLVRASHPAGRGPNSSSLFPPLAAVVAVASGLTDSTRTASPTKRKAPGEVATPWGLFFLVYRMEYPHNSIFSICHSPQKSSVAQKVYKPAAFILQVPHTRACYGPSASAKRPAHRHLLRPAWHPPG